MPEKEYIERDRLYELGYWHGATPTLDNPFPDGVDAVDTKDIDSIPTADVRPVVLCRDCKHKGWVQEPEHGKSVDYCRLIERCVDKQFFCAAGEKREES